MVGRNRVGRGYLRMRLRSKSPGAKALITVALYGPAKAVP
jgi:hypothetical protein